MALAQLFPILASELEELITDEELAELISIEELDIEELDELITNEELDELISTEELDKLSTEELDELTTEELDELATSEALDELDEFEPPPPHPFNASSSMTVKGIFELFIFILGRFETHKLNGTTPTTIPFMQERL